MAEKGALINLKKRYFNSKAEIFHFYFLPFQMTFWKLHEKLMDLRSSYIVLYRKLIHLKVLSYAIVPSIFNFVPHKKTGL